MTNLNLTTSPLHVTNPSIFNPTFAGADGNKFQAAMMGSTEKIKTLVEPAPKIFPVTMQSSQNSFAARMGTLALALAPHAAWANDFSAPSFASTDCMKVSFALAALSVVASIGVFNSKKYAQSATPSEFSGGSTRGDYNTMLGTSLLIGPGSLIAALLLPTSMVNPEAPVAMNIIGLILACVMADKALLSQMSL